MFITALLIIIKTWKQMKYPSVGRWINSGTSIAIQYNITLVQYYSGVLFSTKKNELSSHGKTWRKLKCMLPVERSLFYNYNCMIPTLWCSGKEPWRQLKKSQWLTGVSGEQEMNWQNTKGVQCSKTILDDTVMVDPRHYTFVQTHGIYSTRSEP